MRAQIEKYFPSLRNTYFGLFLVLLGLLLLSGGAIGLQASPEYEAHWLQLPKLDSWVCFIIIWLGIDEMLLRGKATLFILDKTIAPILSRIPIVQRVKRLAEKQKEKAEENADSE